MEEMKKRGLWAQVKNFCRKKPLGAAGIVFLAVLLFIAVFADKLADWVRSSWQEHTKLGVKQWKALFESAA